MWMNRYDIEEAYESFSGGKDAVLSKAVRILKAFQEEVDRCSDGWPYWTPASKAADKLTTLVHSHLRGGMGAYPVPKPVTEAELKAALTPIKRFITARGKAAGMRPIG